MSDAPEPERRRPVGGTAAWRRVDEPRVRAPDDQRRERERYSHASVAEQLADGIAGLRRNRTLLGVLGVIVLGLLALIVLRPTVVRWEELAAGDCIYVRATGSQDIDARPIGTDDAIRARLRGSGAELAGCTLSHSHEVVAIVPVGDVGGAYPGQAALTDAATGACERALAARGVDPSVVEPLVVPPDEARFEAMAAPHAVCLAQRRDGQFLTAPVGG